MLSPSPATWTVRGATFALWALAAGSAAFWGLKISGSSPSLATSPAPSRQVAAADPLAIAKLLGSVPAVGGKATGPAVVTLASRFQLLGVAAAAHSGQGGAVIAVDGKPPRSYRVGSTIEEGLVLRSVSARQAVIASQRDGQVVATLELPRAAMPNGVSPAPGSLPLTPMPGGVGMPATPATGAMPITPMAPNAIPGVPAAPTAPVIAPPQPAPVVEAPSSAGPSARAQRRRSGEGQND